MRRGCRLHAVFGSWRTLPISTIVPIQSPIRAVLAQQNYSYDYIYHNDNNHTYDQSLPNRIVHPAGRVTVRVRLKVRVGVGASETLATERVELWRACFVGVSIM